MERVRSPHGKVKQPRIESSRLYVPVEKDVAAKLRAAAENHGLSTETLLDQWLKEKIAENAVCK